MISKALVVFITLSAPAYAEVVRIEVKSRADVLAGKPFGSVGPYEKLAGTLYFAVDPGNSANQIITDIDKAPKNAAGKVEFSSDFYLLKPKDATKGNGTLLYEVSNRGGKGMLSFFNRATGSLDPRTDAEFGDGFLMERGFTLLWVGWQFDPPMKEGLVRVYPPIARELDGRPIQGLVRSNFVPIQKATEASLADRDHIAYKVSNPDDPANTMTVRDSVEGTPRTIPRADWQFTEDGGSVRMSAGFEPNKIYEVVYRSQDPPVVGVGIAAVRDAISKLKFDAPSELNVPKGALSRAIAFGISQSGRFLRTYLFYGFNEDESHRKVLDGVMAHVAGGGRGSFNHRFAQPSRDAHPYLNFFYPTDIFPFSDVEQRDPQTGVVDGLQTHARKEKFAPNVFYTNSGYEYWGRAASLVHTTIDGLEDARLPTNVRTYLLASGQHGPAGFPPARSIGQQLNNPLDYRWAMRALLVSMNQWIAKGVEPPASAYPRLDKGTLVTPDKLKFPKIPDVNIATTPHKAYRADYGPEFLTKGLVSQEPPKMGSAFPILVPQVDADGNEIAGIRMPELAVPVATYAGWNLFNEKSGPTNTVSSMQGSFIPFPRSREDRQRTNDPRRSVEERYPSRDDYLAAVRKVANELAAKGYLLKEDVPRVVEQTGTRWDYVAGRTGSQ